MADTQYTELMTSELETPYFGQQMLRDVLIPNLLGAKTSGIMYFAGRDLAPRVPVTDEQIPDLFAKLGLGTLTLNKNKVKLRTYTLSGEVVATRIKNFPEADFQFEAGLIAQLVQQVLGMTTEAASNVDKRGGSVELTLSIDPSEEQTIISATRRDR
ncbi:DUF2507 domain-containing protein [Lacticaseibacillus songhuajiangensis]|jgi:hypothetical protein|uniref:DUF2507 domain-containing protein n=1 Tax=Lacticaseibacillus songhuajiangensis TaxID=1296539 RepID=UPI000F7B9381|nr:DUF2507 domain-containing protein [Lacticaseibacillus songhuajiangensis]